jgi:hypothetical protein
MNETSVMQTLPSHITVAIPAEPALGLRARP